MQYKKYSTITSFHPNSTKTIKMSIPTFRTSSPPVCICYYLVQFDLMSLIVDIDLRSQSQCSLLTYSM